ncbi:hypothetical protein E2C01_005420 [Portunus trituberculatus]|uniref:Uncharacterized protein n=1 Tax=Portunus trituberculatus TaxID=210409 RepID=A0A5B7CU03_PORTR|nr:hypothetical protein [Portunus trituberculatus]
MLRTNLLAGRGDLEGTNQAFLPPQGVWETTINPPAGYQHPMTWSSGTRSGRGGVGRDGSRFFETSELSSIRDHVPEVECKVNRFLRRSLSMSLS